jgi:hypothetical protein
MAESAPDTHQRLTRHGHFLFFALTAKADAPEK